MVDETRDGAATTTPLPTIEPGRGTAWVLVLAVSLGGGFSTVALAYYAWQAIQTYG